MGIIIIIIIHIIINSSISITGLNAHFIHMQHFVIVCVCVCFYFVATPVEAGEHRAGSCGFFEPRKL